jgi:large subunit ribosomal protein L25
MNKIVLKATRRSVTGKHVGALRRQGLLPAVMYGHQFEPVAISLNAHDTSLLLSGISSSAIVNIDLEGQISSALVREKQRDPVKRNFVHIDFQVVSMTEKLRTNVSLHIDGVAPAVKDFNGIVVTNVTEVEVEAFPQDLPERIIVDISGLANIGDALHVRDLKVSSAVLIHEDPDEVVVVITAMKEEAEPEVVAEVVEPEVIERGKKEEEEF